MKPRSSPEPGAVDEAPETIAERQDSAAWQAEAGSQP